MVRKMPANKQPRYLADAQVDDAQDAKIRALLTACFTKPQDAVFRTQRYFREPYPHRWVVADGRGHFIAHVGAHEKTARAGAKTYRIAGIAEVCVHPRHRGQGLVRIMLRRVHREMARRGFDFAVLFGDPRVYASSGYVRIGNLFLDGDMGAGRPRRISIAALAAPLSKKPWPRGKTYLPGPVF